MHPAEIPTVSVAELPPDGPGRIVLDVREDDEWAAGHIAGAVHVPMMSLPSRLQFDPGPITPDASVLVVCKVGGRSAQVTAWLNHQGYDAVNLAGGMLAWQQAGRPIVASDGSPPDIV